MNGRRLNVVLAACLYIAVRTEGVQVILLDISDVAEANVYDIGRYYFQICHLLQQNIYTVDPSEYTLRFVEMLNLGDRSNAQVKYTEVQIRETANRLVQRMKRDWIHYGRRPSGVCAAAVLVSARINNVNCRIKDIISIAKCCESTIRKRLSEFVETAASQMTYNEFMSNETEDESNLNEEDPPAYKNSIKEIVDAKLSEVEEYQKIIEKHLKESRPKAKGMYASFLKQVLAKSEMEELEGATGSDEADNKIISEVVLDENISIIDEKMPQDVDADILTGDDPLNYDLNYWANLRPTAQTLGLLKGPRKDEDHSDEYRELLQLDLDDEMNDSEIDSYIVKDATEITQRNLQWTQLNKDYLTKEQEKQSNKIASEEKSPTDDASKPVSVRTIIIFEFDNFTLLLFLQKKKRRRDNKEIAEAATASEAVEAICVQKNKSLNGINLKRLFNEADVESPIKMPTIVDETEAAVEYLQADDEEDNLDEERQEDPQVVNLYHSYAVQPEEEEEEVEEF